ncbi:MAG: TonB-dependent receptor [Sphingobacteriaceae bacterium]|nr:MAG: TonB-dependent receptor [Sphingobacteriaceae bacterium]
MIFFLLQALVFTNTAFAQNQTIRGKITDEKGLGLPGASVAIRGTAVGVSTDTEGNYSISATPANTLVISFIGYVTKNVLVGNQTSINVQLGTTSNSLNEVVVVGYGTQKRADVTGSVSSVSGASLQEVPAAPNVVDQLKGRVAGLDITSNSTTPGAAGQIRLRGERSFASTNTAADSQNGPLFVIDGVPFIGGSFNDINQDDIQSIDVLKDASATAIYGSRASGGVIIITTKRGRSGRSVVSYDANYGISNITKEYPFMNGQQYAALKAQSIIGNVPSLSTAYPLTPLEDAGLANGTNTNWQKLIYRPGFVTDNQLNVSGGNEKTQFSVSGGYHYEKGIQYTQNFDRGSIRATIDHNISDHVKVGLTSFQTLSHTNGVSGILYNTAAISPLTAAYNADGTINLLPMTGSVDQPNRINPLTLRNQYIQAINRRLYTFNSIYGEVKIIDGLKYRLNATINYGQNQGNNYSPVSTVVNTNTTNNLSTESVNNSENYTLLLENILTYDKVFAEKHHITFTGLYSAEKDHAQGLQVYGTGLPADYLQSYNLYLANSVNFNQNNQPYFQERGLISYMARLNYSFNSKYLLTATVRSDGSSVLAAGSQYFTYPAFALGWNVSQENFMKKLTFVNSLKLRAGYGVTADQNVQPYQILGGLSANAYNFGTASLQNGYLVTNLPNTLKFEHTNNINLGIDFGLFKDRITGTIDVYKQRTYDILQLQSLPASNGAQQTTVNAGDSKGEGLEISLSSVNLRNAGGFNWSTDFNIAFARNSILSLHDNLQSDVSNGWFVGQPFNIIYDYKKIGIWQTSEATQAAVYGQRPGQIKVQDVNNDGKINASDLQILGSYQPNFTSGLTNRFSYKGVDLVFVAFARIGQKVAVNYLGADSGGSGYPFFNSGRVNQLNIDYWTANNPTNEFPQPNAGQTGPTYASTLQYRDGSFVKMRSITLGYTIPAKVIQHAGFSSLRIYATTNNPFIVYSPLVKSGLAIDPEGNGYGNQLAGASSFSTNALNRAITVGLSNPPARTFSIGLNAKF